MNNPSPFRRHGPLWIFNRIGILIAFGIMPMMRICHRINMAPVDTELRQAQEKCSKAYDAAEKYNPLSAGWKTNKAAGDYWLSEMQRLTKKRYGE